MTKPRMKFTHTRIGEPCVVIDGLTYTKQILEYLRSREDSVQGADYIQELIRFLPPPRVLE